MLRHFLLMAARSFARHRLYSFINLFGLAAALTCAILVLLFVRYQLSYDDWIPDTSHLYRLEATIRPPGRPSVRAAMASFPVLTAMPGRIPEVRGPLRGDRIPDALAFIDRTWRSFAPGSAIDRYFLSESFESLFKPAQTQDTMLGISVCVALLIACLGLFGLTAFTADRRTMEIGIRKAFGAHTRDIVRLMLRRISIPVMVANVIAWPVAYYYLTRWLEGYAYRISLNPEYFLAGGMVALMIAWMTILVHAVRLARTSPLHALRYE